MRLAGRFFTLLVMATASAVAVAFTAEPFSADARGPAEEFGGTAPMIFTLAAACGLAPAFLVTAFSELLETTSLPRRRGATLCGLAAAIVSLLITTAFNGWDGILQVTFGALLAVTVGASIAFTLWVTPPVVGGYRAHT